MFVAQLRQEREQQRECFLETCDIDDFFISRKGNCKKKALGLTCSVGLRKQIYHILSGSVLRVWNQVEGILATQGGSNSRMQIIRVRTVDGSRSVGTGVGARTKVRG